MKKIEIRDMNKRELKKREKRCEEYERNEKEKRVRHFEKSSSSRSAEIRMEISLKKKTRFVKCRDRDKNGIL